MLHLEKQKKVRTGGGGSNSTCTRKSDSTFYTGNNLDMEDGPKKRQKWTIKGSKKKKKESAKVNLGGVNWKRIRTVGGDSEVSVKGKKQIHPDHTLGTAKRGSEAWRKNEGAQKHYTLSQGGKGKGPRSNTVLFQN